MSVINLCRVWVWQTCLLSPSRAQFFIFPDPAAQLVCFPVGAE